MKLWQAQSLSTYDGKILCMMELGQGACQVKALSKALVKALAIRSEKIPPTYYIIMSSVDRARRFWATAMPARPRCALATKSIWAAFIRVAPILRKVYVRLKVLWPSEGTVRPHAWNLKILHRLGAGTTRNSPGTIQHVVSKKNRRCIGIHGAKHVKPGCGRRKKQQRTEDRHFGKLACSGR